MRPKLLLPLIALIIASNASAVPSNSAGEAKAKADLQAQEAKVKKEAADKEKERQATERQDSSDRKKRFKKEGKPKTYN